MKKRMGKLAIQLLLAMASIAVQYIQDVVETK